MKSLELKTAPPSMPINVDGKHVGDLKHWNALEADERAVVGRHDRRVLQLAKSGGKTTQQQRSKVLRIIVETEDMDAVLALPAHVQDSIISGINASVNSDGWDNTAADAAARMFDDGWDEEDSEGNA